MRDVVTRQNPTSRPDLLVQSTADMADWMRATVGTGHLAGMFVRTGELVHTPREGETGYIPLTGDPDNESPTQVRPVSASVLASLVQYEYWCYKVIKGVVYPAMFPKEAARPAIDLPDKLAAVRPLRGVVHSPVPRADGTILAEPGYDRTTRLLHVPEPGLIVPDVPATPSPVQVAEALGLLREMITDFRFLTKHDEANYLGALLTPLLREMVAPPYKLFALGAPQPGSGKTLLATIARIIHGGVFRSEIPADESELRKQITTILEVTTGPVVQFDNVTGTLRSSTLAGLLTSATWDDRRLGGNQLIRAVNDRFWVVTGNNLSLGGDLVRRTVWCTIDPGVPDPHLRTDFKIAGLEQWARDHRGQLLAALLTLIRAWVAAGRPTEPRGGDGYARWIEAVDGILSVAGMPARFDDPESARQSVGTDDDEWADFLAAVSRVFGERAFTVKELLGHVGTGLHALPIAMDDLPAELAEKATYAGVGAISKSLGRWLANRDGRWAGTFTVRRAGTDRTNIATWRVQTFGGDS